MPLGFSQSRASSSSAHEQELQVYREFPSPAGRCLDSHFFLVVVKLVSWSGTESAHSLYDGGGKVGCILLLDAHNDILVQLRTLSPELCNGTPSAWDRNCYSTSPQTTSIAYLAGSGSVMISHDICHWQSLPVKNDCSHRSGKGL